MRNPTYIVTIRLISLVKQRKALQTTFHIGQEQVAQIDFHD